MKWLLRPWQASDATDLSALADDAGVARWLRDGFPHPYTLADARGFVAMAMAADAAEMLLWAIEVESRAVGSVGLTRFADVHRCGAELGYWLGRPYWGRGIMTEVAREACRRGFSHWDIARIEAEPYADNAPSRRLLEKAGFTLEGIHRRAVVKNGVVQDACCYALLRP